VVAGGGAAPVWGRRRVLDDSNGGGSGLVVVLPCRRCGSFDFTVSGSAVSSHLGEPILGVVDERGRGARWWPWLRKRWRRWELLGGVDGARIGGLPFIGVGEGGTAGRQVDAIAFMAAQCANYESGSDRGETTGPSHLR
jgi:hypothetical protein